jgi:hypothetical protein
MLAFDLEGSLFSEKTTILGALERISPELKNVIESTDLI